MSANLSLSITEPFHAKCLRMLAQGTQPVSKQPLNGRGLSSPPLLCIRLVKADRVIAVHAVPVVNQALHAAKMVCSCLFDFFSQ